MIALLYACISVLTVTLPPLYENPVPLEWPFADGIARSMPIGYGDWCTGSQGPHPGIDFSVKDGDYLRSPLSTNGYIIGKYPVDYPLLSEEGFIVFGTDIPQPGEDGYWGWQYDHISLDGNWDDYAPGHPLSSVETLNLQPNLQNSFFDHLHVYWMWVWENSGNWVPGSINPPEGETLMKGMDNPIKYLPAADLLDFDFVRFGNVWTDNSSKGIWFSPDGDEVQSDFNLIVTPAQFQSEIFGVVDFAAAPYSSFGNNPTRDSCGVYSVGHQLAWKNPYTGLIDPVSYNNTTSMNSLIMEGGTLANYRTLVEMKGEIPINTTIPLPAYTDEYRAAYLDGSLVDDSRFNDRNVDYDPEWFDTAYMLTNCGNVSTGSEGWDNINLALSWDALCHHDWSRNVMCIGGWDTQLRRGDRGGNLGNEQAPISQFALFPDGQYLVDVTATSQGTAFLDPLNQNNDRMYLPTSNVENPNSVPDPVNVDNYRPYVDSLIVYKTTITSFPPVAKIYEAGWAVDENELTVEFNNEVYNYLPIDDTSSDLWIAVRYSEPMDTGSNDVWITGEMKGLNTWTSGTFAPIDILPNWPEEFGRLATNRLSDGIWYLYKYNGGIPSEYKGRLTIHIATEDYRGNAVDGDPSTIASPRSSDGSWPDPQNYESGPDDSYTWGDCSWGSVVDYENETGYYAARVGETEVQRIDFTELEFQFWPGYITGFSVLEYIPYNCGMYACWTSGFINPQQIYCCGNRLIKVVDGNGNVLGSLQGPTRSLNDYVYELDLWLQPASGETEWENKYLWFKERWAFSCFGISDSDEEWCVINGHSGNSNEKSGFDTFGLPLSSAWSSGGVDYYVNCNNPEATYSGGTWSTPVYYIEKYNPSPYLKGYLDISAPSDNQCTGLPEVESESIEHSTPNFVFNLGSILPNPVTSSASISFSLAVSGTYSISIYDVSGRMISNLNDGNMNPGNHSVTWDISSNSGNVVPNGIYYVKLEGCGERAVQSLVVLK